MRARRDAERGRRRALGALREAAATYADADSDGRPRRLMPLIVDAVRARATVGEISDALRERLGRVSPSTSTLGGLVARPLAGG